MSNFSRDLEIRHLAVLQAVAEAGSFWGAADRLDLSPSGISQHVATLEGVAGARLVERSRGRRQVEVTEAGRLLLRHADAILARVRAAESDLEAFRKGSKGSLRVGTYQSIGTRLLPRLLPEFASQWPDVEVRLIEGLTDDQLLERVEAGDLDLTLTTLPTRLGPFQALRLLDDPYVLAVPHGAPFASAIKSVSLRELGGVRLLGIATCQVEVTERFRALGLRPEIWFPSADNAVVQGLVAAHVGVAVMPMLTVDLSDERVGVVPLADMPPRTLGLAWHADRYHSAAFEAFRKSTVEMCAELEAETEKVLARGLREA